MFHLIDEVYEEHSDLRKDILCNMIEKETSIMQCFVDFRDIK